MSQTLQMIITELAALAATVDIVRKSKAKKPPFKQCADCPWSPDVAKRLHQKKICKNHFAILKELDDKESKNAHPL